MKKEVLSWTGITKQTGITFSMIPDVYKRQHERRIKMKKMVPLSKQSKKERRKYYASKRGSWNGVSPVTRVVQSRKIYDRKRMKSADRKICAE